MSPAESRPETLRPALLHPCFWPEVRRGGERIVRELADGLIADGHRPTLITSHPGAPSRSVEDGLDIVRNWRPPQGRLVRRRYEDYLTHVPFSYGTLLHGGFDLAHAFFPTDALAAVRWRERTGRPAIFSSLGVPDDRWMAERRRRAEIVWRAARGSDAVTALSRTAAAAFKRWLGVDAHVIYPGVDLDAFTPAPERQPEPTVFCAAALDEPRKGGALLVSAFQAVRRERPDARLQLTRPRDERLARALETGFEGIELLDPVEDPRLLAGIYGRAWVSVLPSRGDSFGLVLVEALACGTPVVGSNLHAIPEVVDRDTIGRLFDGQDERGLARALLEAFELAADPATPAACRERASDFSTERATRAYEDLYADVLEQR